MTTFTRFVLIFMLVLAGAVGAMAQAPGNMRGVVTDPSGAGVPAASVTLSGPNGLVKVVETGPNGVFTVNGLPPGTYTVRISAPGFTMSERANLELPAGRLLNADVKLSVASEKQEITVTDDTKVELDPAKNASATVLTGADLDMLSDDPDDLQSDLQALAGPSAGPNGGQIFVDGFSNGQLPPKNSIREIRVNSNPFAAEYDKIGFGRVEILTKPGTDKLRGTLGYQADTAALDARNPYSTIKPGFLTQQFQGNLGGSINKKSSFFLDFNRRNQDDQALVRANIPNPALFSGVNVLGLGVPSSALTCSASAEVCAVNQSVATPGTRTSLSPRVDYQLGSANTLQARYTWTRSTANNAGVGGANGTSLGSLGVNSITTTQSAQVTETWVVNTTTINESRFQYTKTGNTQNALNDRPTVSVSGTFSGGGATQGPQFTNTNSYEFQNYTSLSRGAHFVKAGIRMRGTLESDSNDGNFNGLFNFASMTDYLNTLKGTPSWFQYSVTAGQKLADVHQVDLAPFIQDDWKVRPSVTLSLGLRYEWQTNIGDKGDLAPRVGIAWGIGGGQGRLRQPKTVLRAGVGLFYDRFGMNQTLNTIRFNGSEQQRYVLSVPLGTTAPFWLGNLPSIQNLQANARPQTIYTVQPDLVAPRIIQTALGVDRQLPKNITLSLNYTNSRGVHQLRTRNINAPINGVFATSNRNQLYEYESGGLFKESQLTVNMNARLNAKYTMFGFYNYGQASSNTDSVNTFPVNTYDLSSEYGRAGFDIRHRFLIGGNLMTLKGVRLNPFVNFSSAAPFNIVAGRDLNGDSLNNDRPSFYTGVCDPNVKIANVYCTPYGNFNANPSLSEAPIPRNFGNGFGSFNINLRVSRTWGFGEPSGGAANAQPNAGGPPQGGPPGGFGGRGGGGGGGGRPGGPGGFGGGTTNRRYNLTLSLETRNLLNSVNPGSPVGTLGSPFFGHAQGLAGGFGGGPGGGGGGGSQSANRRLELQLRFNF